MPNDTHSLVTEALAISLFASGLSEVPERVGRFTRLRDQFWTLVASKSDDFATGQEFMKLVDEFKPALDAMKKLEALVHRTDAGSVADVVACARSLLADEPPPASGGGPVLHLKSDATRDVHSDVTVVDNGSGNTYAPGSGGPIANKGAMFNTSIGSVGQMYQAKTIKK